MLHDLVIRSWKWSTPSSCALEMLRQQDAAGQVAAHLAGDIVPLGGGDGGVFVGVFLDQILVVVADQGEDGFVGGVGLSHPGRGSNDR